MALVLSDLLRPLRCISSERLRDVILPLRQRSELRNRWLKQRLEELLPKLMKREGFDLWIVIAREYNEDPVLLSLLPDTSLSARRRTILLFHLLDGGTLERLMVYSFGADEFYKRVWDPNKESQYDCLARLVKERNPAHIGINVSETFAFGDRLTHSEYLQLKNALGEEYMARTKGAERLAVGWLETRIQPEIEAYSSIVEIAHAIIQEAFSLQVIHPGITTTDDVVWWMRQKVLDLGLQSWFHPSVSIQAAGLPSSQMGSGEQPQRKVILPGDLLHCDFGLVYLGLCTDTQQNAYVLRLGESDAPEGLKDAVAEANRLQDIHIGEFVAGRTGNEILAASLMKAKTEGIKASIYTHPIGLHGHGAGPIIGLWDSQGGVPGRGDYELFDDTCYAVELHVRYEIPEWSGQEIRLALEQDVVFTGGKVYWLGGRQKELHLIG